MSQITMRNLDPGTEQSLRRLARQRRQSLSTVTLSLVRQALGTAPAPDGTPCYRDLSSFVGLWSAEEAAAFDAALADQSIIDTEMWT